MAAPPLALTGLSTHIGGRVLHDDVTLELKQGEIMGLVGGSGTGKSLLMRTILGLHPYDAGHIALFGQEEAALDAQARLAQRRHMGVLFQNAALFSSLTVAQNIAMPLREFYPHLPPEMLGALVASKIALVGLAQEDGEKYPAALSGGMKKRVGLARALALDPKLLFLDEPTAGLDPISAAGFDSLIKQLRESLNLSVLLVTHDLDSLHQICDRVAVLADTRIIICDTIARVRAHPHPWIAAYFSGIRGRAAQAAHEKGELG
jgi:phospholipid/cholesterol/gamma-HCH transport system ATP-binding protein